MPPDDTAAASSSELLPVVYEELRRLARGIMAAEPAQTLSATALVHEAWLRVSQDGGPRWENRRHFFGAAAQAMRRILLNRIRSKRRLKRGGGQKTVPLEEVVVEVAAPESDEAVLTVDAALDQLMAQDPLAGEIVNLRFFVGLKWAEIAEMTGISERDLNRHWAFARAWLKTEIGGN
ncbi:MAG: sigma-70 family RNA polymerase sigma factor [Verrucomicrobiales bacterium]|nr:sigma-70 family RNA polymerase sigma factor [Verrucomicrobiales bacterium]